MPKVVQTATVLFLLFLFAVLADKGCATASKSSGYTKKKQASHVNASQLGRNKYYFSTHYQNKLSKSNKK
jgi:hypothetical protein